MKRILILVTLLILFLTSCTGVDSRKMENILADSNCLYNDEYGIELNKLYAPCYSSGYITTDTGELEVLVLWNFAVKKMEFYSKENIDSSLESEEDCFKYFDSEAARDNIIATANIKYDENIIIKVVDSSVNLSFDEITLKSK